MRSKRKKDTAMYMHKNPETQIEPHSTSAEPEFRLLKNVIASRRSIGQTDTSKAVPQAVVQQLLESACWAPTHHRTEPWRFVVFSGEGLVQLAQAMAEASPDVPDIKQKAYRAPTVILVWCAAGRSKGKIPPLWEEHAAVAAACQNMLLCAHALGLAAIWRSGSLVEHPAMHALCSAPDTRFDANKGDRIMGCIYVGYPQPDALPPLRPTPDWQGKTQWMGEAL